MLLTWHLMHHIIIVTSLKHSAYRGVWNSNGRRALCEETYRRIFAAKAEAKGTAGGHVGEHHQNLNWNYWKLEYYLNRKIPFALIEQLGDVKNSTKKWEISWAITEKSLCVFWKVCYAGFYCMGGCEESRPSGQLTRNTRRLDPMVFFVHLPRRNYSRCRLLSHL